MILSNSFCFVSMQGYYSCIHSLLHAVSHDILSIRGHGYSGLFFSLGVILIGSTLLDTTASMSEDLSYKLLSFVYDSSKWISTMYGIVNNAKQRPPHQRWVRVIECWAIWRIHIAVPFNTIRMYGNCISPIV